MNKVNIQPKPNRYFIFVQRLVTVAFALLIYLMLMINLIENKQSLAVYSLLLVTYLYAEVKHLYKYNPNLIWINPVILASILTFALPFGITNLLFFMPEETLTSVQLEPVATIWMNQLMLLVILGACAMWVGYSSRGGRGLAKLLQQNRFLRRYILSSVRMDKRILCLLFMISLIAKLLAIKLGIYGYATAFDQITDAASYSQYISFAQLLGKLALLVAAIQYFSTPRITKTDKILLWIIAGSEVIFGFLSAMKSAVIIPFIIVGIAYYSQRHRFPYRLIPLIFAGLIAAYSIIEPFRAMYNESAGSMENSLSSIATAMMTAHSNVDNSGIKDSSTGLSILSRSNLTYIASLGIEYKANNKELPEDSPAFLSNIIFAPLHAVIPRFLWNNKPMTTDGLWYTHEVIGHDYYSSTAMSPFTYLNFAGGYLAVIIGFFFVGLIQRGLFDGLKHFGGGGLIILLGLLQTLSIINNSYNVFISDIVRFFPILVFVQYFLIYQRKIN